MTVRGNTALGGEASEDIYLWTDYSGTAKVSLSGECDLGSGLILDDYGSSASSQPFIQLNDGFTSKGGAAIVIECDWPAVGTQIVSGDADPSMFSLVNADDLILKKIDSGLELAESVDVTFVTYKGSTAIKVASGDTIPDSAYPAASDRAGFSISGWMCNGSEWDAATSVDDDITLTAVWEFEDGTLSIGAGDPGETLLLTAATPKYEGVAPAYSWSGPATGSAASQTAAIGGTYNLTVTYTEGTKTKVLTASVTVRTVTFDDSVIQTRILVADGDDIPESSYPAISERDGFISMGWAAADTSAVTSDMTVTALWMPLIDVQVAFSGELVKGGSITATVTTDYVPDDSANLWYMMSGMDEPVSGNVFTISSEGDYSFYIYAIIGTIDDPEVVAVGISETYSIRYSADPGTDIPSLPFPDDDDDYVPLPPHIVYEDEGGSDGSVKIVACVAAAVIAAILVIVLATTYRRR